MEVKSTFASTHPKKFSDLLYMMPLPKEVSADDDVPLPLVQTALFLSHLTAKFISLHFALLSGRENWQGQYAGNMLLLS